MGVILLQFFGSNSMDILLFYVTKISTMDGKVNFVMIFLYLFVDNLDGCSEHLTLTAVYCMKIWMLQY